MIKISQTPLKLMWLITGLLTMVVGVILITHAYAAGQVRLPDKIIPSGSVSEISQPGAVHQIKTVFVIVLENHDWRDIKGNPSASYINQTLLPQAAYATQYRSPHDIHPSEPNYLWLEAGTSFGIQDDEMPSKNHQQTNKHLVTLLDKAGISWKAYQEGISGKVCPLTNSGLYTPRHNPMVYFDDVTGNNDPNSAYCISHERPLSELAPDLQQDTVARYNFITPDLCHGMHDIDNCDSTDSVKNGDAWLSTLIPTIMKSKAYQEGGVIFITWDESEKDDQPIGMLVLSPFAKGGGYSNDIHYTHSSTLLTVEEIFGMDTRLGDSAHSNDLSDLFAQFP